MCIVAHDEHPQRAVTEERGEVDAEPSLADGDPLGERLPTPLDPDIEEHLRQLLDLTEHPRHPRPLMGMKWRE